jgi:hypothetical protein
MQESVYFVTEHRRARCEPYLLYLRLAVHEARVYEQPSGGRVSLLLQCFQKMVPESCDGTIRVDEYTYTNSVNKGVKCGSTYPAKSQVALRNIDLYRACNFASEDQNLLVSKCSLPAVYGNGNQIDAFPDRCKYEA